MFTRKKRGASAKATIFTALLSLLASFLAIVSAPVPAQAFSNTGAFNFGTSQVIIEDLALCTKYKYNFDAGPSWNQTGYETCPSEELTTANLPATLHLKLRVQAIVTDEFQASYAGAFISDSSGNRITTPRWNLTPLVDLDGPVNINNATFYGAFSLLGTTFIPGEKYSLTIQFWNGQWLKLNGPNIPETPKSFVPFTFTVGSANAKDTISKPSNSNSPGTSCVVDSWFTTELAKSKANTEAITAKANSITDLSAPGILEFFDQYLTTLNQEAQNVYNLGRKADGMYSAQSSNSECDGYLYFISEVSAVKALIAQAQSLLTAYYSKSKAITSAKSANTVDAAFCESQGNAALTSIKKSMALFSLIQSKIQAGFDIKQKAAVGILNDWNQSLSEEYRNIETWNTKIPEYLKQDLECKSFLTAQDWVIQSQTQYKSLNAQVNALLEKAKVISQAQQQVEEEKFSDEDGVEEEPAATLAVSYSASLGRYILKVESNLPEETLTIRATKKGARTLRFSINTDEDGIGGIRTKTKLSGYTLVLSFGSDKLDQVRVK